MSATRKMKADTKLRPGAKDALVVVDVQNDFCPGGRLAVPKGDEIVPLVNALAGRFENVVLTQDWHPAGHISFATSHPGRKPFDSVKLAYGAQMLWPDHCLQGLDGAALHKALSIAHAQLVIRKGWHKDVDSYSAFLEADRRTRTGLDGYLRERGIKRVFVCGLATDFCVAWTALDARKLGFAAVVIEDACRAIDDRGSLDSAWKKMKKAGVTRAGSGDFA
jgi:nicotinamidase/pyrazinamidase